MMSPIDPNDLLDLGRIEAGLGPPKERLNVVPLVKEAVALSDSSVPTCRVPYSESREKSERTLRAHERGSAPVDDPRREARLTVRAGPAVD